MKNGWEKVKKRAPWKEIVLIGGLAILLIIACWQVFIKEDVVNTAVPSSAEETRLKEILEKIDGVGSAEVMISDGETNEKGVVIVCEGANNISVLIDVREAAATALGINQQNVKIYLKNKQ